MTSGQGPRLAWGGVIAALTVALVVAGIVDNIATLGSPDLPGFIGLIGIVTFLLFPAMGLVVVRHQSANAVGWLLLGIGLNVFLIFNSGHLASLAAAHYRGPLPFQEVFSVLAGTAWVPFILMLLLFLPMLFPDGRLLSRRWLIPIVSGLLFALMALLGNIFIASNGTVDSPGLANPLANPSLARTFQPLIDLSVPFGLLALIGSVSSVIVRYRRGDGLQRHQLRWFLFALVLAATPFLLNNNGFLSNVLLVLFVPLLPISIAVAVLRYRLYEIDVVINRSLVYAALGAFITLVYVGIVVGIGSLIGSQAQPNLALSILATAVVAVAFQPVRERVQRLANRLVYGKRATPYEVMADFSERMSETLAPDEVLPRMAEAASRGVAADAARVAVAFPDGSRRAVWWPREQPEAIPNHRVAVNYHDQLVGEIAVYKAPGASLTTPEAKLLADLASQAGLVLHNVRLTAELQTRLTELTSQAEAIRASRQRLVTAATAERQRLEQTIRQGTEEELASLATKLATIEPVLGADPQRAGATLEALTGDIQRTLDALRHLAHGVYPPLLRDQGLVPALRAQTAKSPNTVEIVSDSVGRYAAEIEAAVYFACLESLRNAVATSRITVAGGNGVLHFAVTTPGHRTGSLQAIEDRVAALGGRLERRPDGISGTIPVPVEAAV